MTAAEIKLANLKKWKLEAGRKMSAAFTVAECDAAIKEYNRADSAYLEHCREFGLDREFLPASVFK